MLLRRTNNSSKGLRDRKNLLSGEIKFSCQSFKSDVDMERQESLNYVKTQQIKKDTKKIKRFTYFRRFYANHFLCLQIATSNVNEMFLILYSARVGSSRQNLLETERQ